MNSRTVLDILDQDPATVAVVEAGKRRVSRGQLKLRILARATQLQRAGIKPGERVVIQEKPGIEFAITSIAVLVTGGVLVLAEAGMAAEIYRTRLEKAQVRWIVTGRAVAWLQRIPLAARSLRHFAITLPPRLPDPSLTTLVTPLPHEKRAEAARPVKAIPRRGADLAVIVFTGGTTENPKGVCLSHEALAYYLASIEKITQRYAISTFVADTPQQILYGLYLGVGVWVPAGRDSRRASRIARCLVSGEAQMFFGPPSVWVRILQLVRDRDLPAPTGLRLVMLGGAPVTNTLLQQLTAWLSPETEITILYGLTEIGPVCTCSAQSRLEWDGPGNLVGSPLPHVTTQLRNPDSNGVGELLVSGPSAFTGYLGEPPGEGTVRTGDLATFVSLRGVRQVVLMGRSKDMIIRNGVNLYPSAIEPVFLGIRDGSARPLFRDCAVVGIWNEEKQDEEVVLFVVPGAGFEKNSKAMTKDFFRYVSDELVPDHTFTIHSIPQTGRQGKPDKKRLRVLAAEKLGIAGAGPGLGAGRYR